MNTVQGWLCPLWTCTPSAAADRSKLAVVQLLTADRLAVSQRELTQGLSDAQATTFLQIEDAAGTESGEDVAHLLALLPGLRCVGIGGKWADSPESWAAIVPTLSVCQDLRFSGVRGHGNSYLMAGSDHFRPACPLPPVPSALDRNGRAMMCRKLRNRHSMQYPCYRAAGRRSWKAAAAAGRPAHAAEFAGGGGVQRHSRGCKG